MNIVTFESENKSEVVQTVRKSEVWNLRNITVSSPSDATPSIHATLVSGSKREIIEDEKVIFTEYVWTDSISRKLAGAELVEFMGSDPSVVGAWAGFMGVIEGYCRTQGWIPADAKK